MASSFITTTIRNRPLTSIALGVIGSAYAVEEVTLYRKKDAATYLPRHYDAERIRTYWSSRPVTVVKRFIEILTEAIPVVYNAAIDWEDLGDSELQRQHAVKLKLALTRLGPAFVKIGQQISIRPDLAPPPVLKELQTLCDSVEKIDDEVALKILLNELRRTNENIEDLNDIFEMDSIKMAASASLGQVYKAKVRESGEDVAVKVQRPDMVSKVSLDLFLLHMYAKSVDAFTSTFTQQAPFHDELIRHFAAGSYTELDYEREAYNQIRFKEEFKHRKCSVFIPNVHKKLSSQRVLTTEWVNGVKLADAPKDQVRSLIPIGVELFLTQLLDIGAFHSDPHSSNLYVTSDGTLCLLDFGLVAEIDENSQKAMTAAIMHLISGDFSTLIRRDAKELGFLPENYDTVNLEPLLTKILTEGLLESGSNLRIRKRKLMEISNELNELFFKYPFNVPPFFALITRGLGLLEGIALSGDPEFDIFQASYPYARRRAIELFGVRGLSSRVRY